MLVNAIQEACLKILQEEGPEQLTTQRIADVAGVNIASLYQYFPNKEAILGKVFQQRIQQYSDCAKTRFSEIDKLSRASLEDTLAAIVEMEVEQRLMLLAMDAEFYRAYQHNFDIHRKINELTISMSNPGWEEWFPDFLQRHKERLRSNDVQRLSRIASHAITGVLLSAISEDPDLLTRDEFKEDLSTLLIRYLCKSN